MIEFLNLNDDCLEHLFRFLDLKALCAICGTCKRLEEVAEEIFRKHHKNFKCSIRGKKDVKEANKIMQKVGHHLIGLHLTVDPIDSELFAERSIGCQFLEQLNCWLGENFRELTLYGECSILILQLAPIFLKAHKLTIGVNKLTKHYSLLDLPQLCPSLRSLRIENFRLTPNTTKSFPNLEELQIVSYAQSHIYPTEMFVSLIQSNRKLKTLYIDVGWIETNLDLTFVVKNLKDLEDLRIRTVITFSDHNISAEVESVKGLDHLTTLVMSKYWGDVNEVNSVLAVLKQLKQLKTLWIGIGPFTTNGKRVIRQSLVDIVKSLTLLESFVCYGIYCELDTIIGIVQFGRKLKRLGMDLDFLVTVASAENLANVRKLAAGEQSPLLINFNGPARTLSEHAKQVFEKPHIGRILKWDPSSSRDLIESCFTNQNHSK